MSWNNVRSLVNEQFMNECEKQFITKDWVRDLSTALRNIQGHPLEEKLTEALVKDMHKRVATLEGKLPNATVDKAGNLIER